MILLTSDIDWAPEEAIQDMLNLFERYEVNCTLFCTHESSVLKDCNRELFELAIHPNFNPLLSGNSEKLPSEIMKELMKIYPEAQGVRSHSLTRSTHLLSIFKEHNMVYESNCYLPYSKVLVESKQWNGIYSVPHNWEDDFHFMYGKSYEDLGLDYHNIPLAVFDFHPIHVFLNTHNHEHYENAKKYYQDAGKLKDLQNTTLPGVRDALVSLLVDIKENDLPNMKMIEYVNSKLRF